MEVSDFSVVFDVAEGAGEGVGRGTERVHVLSARDPLEMFIMSLGFWCWGSCVLVHPDFFQFWV